MSKKTRKKFSKSPAVKAGRASSKTASSGARRAKATKASAKAPKKASAKAAGTSRKTGAAKPAKTRAAKAVQPKSSPAKKRAAASATRSRTPSKARVKSSTAKPESRTRPRTKQAAIANPKPAQSTSAEISAKIAASVSPAARPLAEGSRLPAFTLPRDGGERVPLAPARGRNLVIFFYPRADTPGCTKEAMDFSRLAAAFDQADTDVVGVSADPQRAQEAFRRKYDLTMPLLSDESHDILEAFGVWGEKSMYGKTFLGILRTTVAVGPDGRINKIWRNVKVDGHAEDVLDYVRSA